MSKWGTRGGRERSGAHVSYVLSLLTLVSYRVGTTHSELLTLLPFCPEIGSSSHKPACPLITKVFHGKKKKESWRFLIQWLYILSTRALKQTISTRGHMFKARNLDAWLDKTLLNDFHNPVRVPGDVGLLAKILELCGHCNDLWKPRGRIFEIGTAPGNPESMWSHHQNADCPWVAFCQTIPEAWKT